jgi:hypothetical protein
VRLERGDACAPRLRSEQHRGDGRDAVSEQSPRDARHRRGAEELDQVVPQHSERARQPVGEQGFKAVV